METKKCLECGIEFPKPKYISKKNWIKVRKFCGIDCKVLNSRGKPHQSKTKFKKGHKPWNTGKKLPQISGDKHPMWKGGRIKRKGYIFLLRPEHQHSDSLGYVREHRLVMEEYLGRLLEPKEVVHHKNEIKYDNRIENLQLFENNGKHTSYHLRFLRN